MRRIAVKHYCTTLLSILITLGGLLIVACQPVLPAAAPASDTTQAGAFPGNYPVTVESCGEPVTFAAVPERMVVFENNLLEIALLLGLHDRIAGIWTGSSTTVDPAVQPLADELFAISTEGWPPPALEPVLGVEPDFVWSGWGYGFSEESGLTPAKLNELGIPSYTTSESCIKAGLGEPVTIESTYTDILNIGQIFGVEDEAQALVDGMKSRVDAAVATVGPVARPLRVFFYDSGEDAPFSSGQSGMLSVMMALVGGENIFADIEKDWATVSWEEVIARDPEVIIVANSAWASAEENINFLKSKPELAGISAMQNERFGTISYRQSTPGLPNAEAVELLAQALYPEQFQ
jgi:iron complex transport system substrate-binding protein